MFEVFVYLIECNAKDLQCRATHTTYPIRCDLAHKNCCTFVQICTFDFIIHLNQFQSIKNIFKTKIHQKMDELDLFTLTVQLTVEVDS